MFTLTVHDRKGNKLSEGDIVQISEGRHFTFWAEVKFLEQEQVLAPFHTFSFHSFEKVKEVPPEAVKSTEIRYGIWYLQADEDNLDEDAGQFERYLSSWRECEHLLSDRVYRIQKIK